MLMIEYALNTRSLQAFDTFVTVNGSSNKVTLVSFGPKGKFEDFSCWKAVTTNPTSSHAMAYTARGISFEDTISV